MSTRTTAAPATGDRPAKRSGSRRALPPREIALRVCAECGAKRGTKRVGWVEITRDGEVVGYTCPGCPEFDEPIRRMVGKSGAVSFRAVVKGQQRTFPTVEQAREWVAEAREAGRAGHALPDDQLTVQQLADRWLKRRQDETAAGLGVREVTIEGYRSALASPLAVIGNRRASDVTTDDVEGLLVALATKGGKAKRPLSHRSLTYALVTLRQVFAYGVKIHATKANPAADARVPKARKARTAKAGGTTTAATQADKPTWTGAQLVAFRDFVDEHQAGKVAEADPWVRAGMRLTLCGLRRSEVLGLTWSAVDLKRGTVQIRASRVKTGAHGATATEGAKTKHSERTVRVDDMHPGTSKILRELWMAQGRPSGDSLVIVDNLGQAVAPDTYSYRFRALSKAAGLPDLGSIHRVRHSLALMLHSAGVVPNDGASILGHDVATHLSFYLPTNGDSAARGAAAVGAALAAVRL
ncbi:tyrosine-type recombinase/integrase [Raineyella sp. LH-20]|uniref:tyrosine-type recombinase/integrase n=1 Tax=Raineyella sp. LH-20 TaxID=3081204 RepID=UPI002953C445|nr:tyrosine-type recombinase/integrase [Raineyella sp. LH-20]WOP17409.1 tyrosine-type recombinase/integrase [Raineyella sp. LH-20]